MGSAVVLALIALLAIAHINDVAASCRKVPNDEMLEYLCEGGHPGDFATVPETTEKLRINRMPLRRITADTFAKFGDNLWVLSCSYCEISDVETNAFRRLVNLQQLSLDNNYLTTVKASWFKGLDFLTYLDVNYNDIRNIEDDVYQNLPSLVDFRISGNRLRCLNLDRMSRLRHLKRMFLSENPEFACPHAVSEFLENQHIDFDPDPEWRRLAHDMIEVHVPPTRVEGKEEEEEAEVEVSAHHDRYPDRRPSHQPEAPVVPPLTGDRMFHPVEHQHGHRRKPTTTTTTTTSTTMRPIALQSHIPRVEPIPPPEGVKTSYQSPPDQRQSTRPVVFFPYPIPEIPRAPLLELQPPLEDARMTAEADRPPLTEDALMHPSHVPTHETTSSYPSYVTLERSRAPSMESIPSSENIRLMTGTDRTPSAEHTLTYPTYIPVHETTSAYPSYVPPEGSRVPLVESKPPSEQDTSSTARPNKPMLTEHTLTYPPYEPTYETMSYPYVTSERSRLPVVESKVPSEYETTTMTWSDESSRSVENAVIHPLYITTPDGREKTPHGPIHVTESWSTSDSDSPIISRTWSTDDSMEHYPGDIRSQNAGRHRERPSWSWSTTEPPTTRQETSYYVSREPIGRDYTPDNKALVGDQWSSSTDDFFIATDLPAERGGMERPRTTVRTTWSNDEDADKGDLHYVRPVPASHPEMMHPISTDELYQAPYYESTITVRPLLDYQEHDDDEEGEAEELTIVMGTTTDKPLPDCPKKNSSPRTRPASILIMSIVVIFGHVVVAGF